MAMNSNNVGTQKGALHNGKIPGTPQAVGTKAAAAYNRTSPVTPNISQQTGMRTDLPGQR